jgi:hypothetical protein
MRESEGTERERERENERENEAIREKGLSGRERFFVYSNIATANSGSEKYTNASTAKIMANLSGGLKALKLLMYEGLYESERKS